MLRYANFDRYYEILEEKQKGPLFKTLACSPRRAPETLEFGKGNDVSTALKWGEPINYTLIMPLLIDNLCTRFFFVCFSFAANRLISALCPLHLRRRNVDSDVKGAINEIDGAR